MSAVFGSGTAARDCALNIANKDTASACTLSLKCVDRRNVINNSSISGCSHCGFHIGDRRGLFGSVLGINRRIDFMCGVGGNVDMNGRCGGALHNTFKASPVTPICDSGGLCSSPCGSADADS